jgi:hypothetical protein
LELASQGRFSGGWFHKIWVAPPVRHYLSNAASRCFMCALSHQGPSQHARRFFTFEEYRLRQVALDKWLSLKNTTIARSVSQQQIIATPQSHVCAKHHEQIRSRPRRATLMCACSDPRVGRGPERRRCVVAAALHEGAAGNARLARAQRYRARSADRRGLGKKVRPGTERLSNTERGYGKNPLSTCQQI